MISSRRSAAPLQQRSSTRTSVGGVPSLEADLDRHGEVSERREGSSGAQAQSGARSRFTARAAARWAASRGTLSVAFRPRARSVGRMSDRISECRATGTGSREPREPGRSSPSICRKKARFGMTGVSGPLQGSHYRVGAESRGVGREGPRGIRGQYSVRCADGCGAHERPSRAEQRPQCGAGRAGRGPSRRANAAVAVTRRGTGRGRDAALC